MVSLTRIPNIHREDLAQQSLLLRVGLIPLFLTIAFWVSGWHFAIIAAVLAYVVSSTLLAVGYRGGLLGSSDVIYTSMVDTGLFLGAGVVLTGGAQSPVLFLFFGLQAAYLVLANPKVFVASTTVAAVVIIAAVAWSLWGFLPSGVDHSNQPFAHILAAVGALIMLASLGSWHSVSYVARSQAKQHLNAVLSAFRRAVRNQGDEQHLASILSNLMTTLKITDEGAIYSYDPDSGNLKLEVGLGLRPWIQAFPEFLPEEGPVGDVFQKNRRLICEERKQLGQHLKNLTPKNSDILGSLLKQHTPPSYTAGVPVKWKNQAIGVLMVSRQKDTLDDSELQLMEGIADHIAATLNLATLAGQVTQLETQSTMFNRLEKLQTSINSPGRGLQEFVQQLKEFVPFNSARVLTVSDVGVEPALTYYWAYENPEIDLAELDAYLQDSIQNQPSLATFVGNVEVHCPEGALASVIPPELAEQGICSILVIAVATGHSDGSPLRSMLALIYQDPESCTEESTQIAQSIEPYFEAMVSKAAASLHFEKTCEQVESLCTLVSLSHIGNDEDQVVRNVIQGVSRLLHNSASPPISAVLTDDEKGATSAVTFDCSSPDQFRPLAASEHAPGLKKLLQEWGDPQPEVFAADSTSGVAIRELVGVSDYTSLLCFPLHAAGKTFGVLAINCSADHVVTQLEKSLIQRVTDVGALCLQNSRQYEAQARQIRELQQEDELRRSFLSYITHEFRTPLSSLKTSFELIQEAEVMRGLDDPYQRLLTNVNRSVAILDQLINDMSEVANISAGGVVLNKTLTPPEAIIYPVVETTSPLSHLKSQTLEVEIQPGLPKLTADAHRLEQVLTNMVSNAIKYTPKGGSIKTVVSQENGCIQFAVSDTGQGIPKEDLEKVFDPFYRVPLQSADRTPGTGLGLALAKSLVELHGGNIWVESESKKGSTFYFTIPIESRN